MNRTAQAAQLPRRRILAGAGTVAVLAAAGGTRGMAEGVPQLGNHLEPEGRVVSLRPVAVPVAEEGPGFLFVQTARRMRFDQQTGLLALEDVAPVTLFFSDRPERIAGNMETARFPAFWGEGSEGFQDSFRADPPNADISILQDGRLVQAVVELHDPMLEGDTLTYRAEVLDGPVPEAGDDVSVFIDIIGMPMTPVSYAGVGRREFRRAYWD